MDTIHHIYNIPLVVMIVLVVIALLASLIFNAMAALDARASSCSSEKKTKDSIKWSTWSAVINGISIVLIVISLVFYFVIDGKKLVSEITNPFAPDKSKVTGFTNTALIILVCIGIGLLFTSMILSSIAASDVNSSSCALEKDARNSHKWATISAILNGFAVLVLGFALGFYIYTNREDYRKSVQDKTNKILIGMEGKYPKWIYDKDFIEKLGELSSPPEIVPEKIEIPVRERKERKPRINRKTSETRNIHSPNLPTLEELVATTERPVPPPPTPPGYTRKWRENGIKIPSRFVKDESPPNPFTQQRQPSFPARTRAESTPEIPLINRRLERPTIARRSPPNPFVRQSRSSPLPTEMVEMRSMRDRRTHPLER